MDSISTALIGAISAGITDVGKKAIADAYENLKALISAKLGQENDISEAIAALEDNPESEGRRMVLAETMTKEKAVEDSEIQEYAGKLIETIKETEEGRKVVAKFLIDAKGAQVGVIGDNARVQGGIHFRETK
ncbi:hypothetical protein LPW11_09800 [Geomonas sp. RF6]|uniref:hypothetical protein n=1 Tax=Geomonas sp. RF6 TaxID=2897342 RepID=UPI001E371593|nr:hypothetical protein [Geomonas sp. RF6]UFS72468.1 hypothetical protein LPW11_09800 [Geomonas sp. RF6]